MEKHGRRRRMVYGAAGALATVAAATAVATTSPLGPARAEVGYRICALTGTQGVYLTKVAKSDSSACAIAHQAAAKLAGKEISRYSLLTCESASVMFARGLFDGDICRALEMSVNQLYRVGANRYILEPLGDVVHDEL